FYGARVATRLFLVLWAVMSLGGLAVEVIFRSAGWVPSTHRTAALRGEFPLGATLVLNAVALVVLGAVAVGARRDADTSVDPVCGMAVDRAAPAATVTREGVTHYFCSPRCAERFEGAAPTSAAPAAIDPVCGMSAGGNPELAWTDDDGVTWHFCGAGCRDSYARGRSGVGS
ncbi:MAG: YHS domain-containing protein, partial [Acidimicrobiales bacterium]